MLKWVLERERMVNLQGIVMLEKMKMKTGKIEI